MAILGSGNIAIDLMFKISRSTGPLTLGAMVGIDPHSAGLQHDLRHGVPITANGIVDLLAMPNYGGIKLVFDATSASDHRQNWAMIKPTGLPIIDLTPSAIGTACVPPVNVTTCLSEQNISMVTCGAQATVPLVSAISRLTPVVYAEVVSTISAKSAGPNTRANIDEFIETTSAALENIGGAQRGRTIMIVNPAKPSMLMRNTVHCVLEGCFDEATLKQAINETVEAVRSYVPGYRLTQEIQCEPVADRSFVGNAGDKAPLDKTKVTVLLEIAGAGDYLPTYAGNLDIMTAAAITVAEKIVRA